MVMLLLKPDTGHVKVLWIREFAIKKNSTESNPIDVCKCLPQFPIASRNVNSVGEI